jgi:hypothetical protein
VRSASAGTKLSTDEGKDFTRGSSHQEPAHGPDIVRRCAGQSQSCFPVCGASNVFQVIIAQRVASAATVRPWADRTALLAAVWVNMRRDIQIRPLKYSLFWTTASPYKSGVRYKIQEGLIGNRAAIYRVSTADQARERQEFDLRAFARRAGYDVEYLRKQVQELNSTWPSERKSWRLPTRQIDAILSLSFPGGRSTLDLLNTLRELENW